MPPAVFGIGKRHTAESNRNKEHTGDDSELVLRCQNGERQAQYELYQRYKDWVFNIAYRMSNNRQDAEDITQKVFVRVFGKIESFRGDSAFSSWLYRLAANVCINHFRKEKRRKQSFSNQIEDYERMNSNPVKEETQKVNIRPYLEKAIRALPEGYRMIFILYDMQGYSHKEIGAMLNISEGTSKSQLHKARKELKQSLEPYLMMHKLF